MGKGQEWLKQNATSNALRDKVQGKIDQFTKENNLNPLVSMMVIVSVFKIASAKRELTELMDGADITPLMDIATEMAEGLAQIRKEMPDEIKDAISVEVNGSPARKENLLDKVKKAVKSDILQ